MTRETLFKSSCQSTTFNTFCFIQPCLSPGWRKMLPLQPPHRPQLLPILSRARARYAQLRWFFFYLFPEISLLSAQGHFYMNNLNSNGLLNPIMWYYLIIETSFLECLDGTKAFSVKTDFVWPQTFWWCAELQILSIALLPGKHWIRNCEPRSLCWKRVVDCPFGGAG